jgi:hypothetical protein
MWWLRRMATVTCGCACSRSRASAMARRMTQGPGKYRPSHTTAAPWSATVCGSPSRVMPPSSRFER